MGTASDGTHVESFLIKGNGKKFIRHITLSKVAWESISHEPYIIGGLTFRWSDGSSDTAGTMFDAGTPNITKMEVPVGEHVSFVIGDSGWYVDCLTFVASSGRTIGKGY